MPGQYTINGTITLGDGTKRAGIRVQAFDRDLPSIELRRLPQRLGEEAITNSEGIFQIRYTPEQFQRGEAIAGFRKQNERHADISFIVLDSNERKLNIEIIKALHHEYSSDEVIFNVPTSMEVSIFVSEADQPGASEYEQLLALIAPVVEDLPLIELSDEDLGFLSNELGLEQQREVQQRIEWLRRCALLTQETNLPVESFYGWGRKDVPASFTELATVPLTNLRSVLEKLTSLPAEELRRALLVAIDENIIPARMRERASVIANTLRRRGQKEYVLSLRLELTPTEPLDGYMVTTVDIDANERDLGTDVTDALGEFAVAYFAGDNAERSFRFHVRGPGIGDPVEVTHRIRPDAKAPVGIRISLAAAQLTL